MIIAAQVLVKNETRFIWYAVMSVIDYVDKVYVWDTGSTDGTLEIIKQLPKDKIVFHQEQVAHFNEEEIRQKMLNETTEDWFIVVDGDEIWWDDSIQKVTDFIKTQGGQFESVVTPTVNVVGDMFHYQESKAGKYTLAGKTGHYNLRAVNRTIPGLKSVGEHGQWGWVDGSSTMIQDRDPGKIKFLNASYLHATHLRRSGSLGTDKEVVKRQIKFKYEIGLSFPPDYYYPEVFFRPRPRIVPSVWKTMSAGYSLRAAIETPLRKINRRIMPAKVGY